MPIFSKFTEKAGVGLSSIKDSASALATDLQGRAASAADVRHLLKIIDMVPGIAEAAADYNDLRKSLAVIQMGRLCCFITFEDAHGLDVSFSRTDTLTPEILREHISDMDFTSAVLADQTEKGADAIHMIVNKTHFMANRSGITADVLASALLVPVDNIPIIGGIIAKVLQGPVRAIARFLIDTMSYVAGGALNMTNTVTTGVTGVFRGKEPKP